MSLSCLRGVLIASALSFSQLAFAIALNASGMVQFNQASSKEKLSNYDAKTNFHLGLLSIKGVHLGANLVYQLDHQSYSQTSFGDETFITFGPSVAYYAGGPIYVALAAHLYPTKTLKTDIEETVYYGGYGAGLDVFYVFKTSFGGIGPQLGATYHTFTKVEVDGAASTLTDTQTEMKLQPYVGLLWKH